MGVSISGKQDQEKITFSCDHPGCSAKTVRMVHPHWYSRQTGRTYRRHRPIRNPIAYWAKVLRTPRRRNIAPFFLLGISADWPKDVRVFCEEHHAVHKQNAAQKPIPEWRAREMKRYQEQRIDVF